MKKEYKPTSHGRASICTWTLSFRFYCVEQRSKFIELVNKDKHLSEQMVFNVWTVCGDSFKPYEYWLEIEDYSWANNLTHFAKLLEKCDYTM